MGLRFIVTVKQGPREKARIVAEHIVDARNLTVEDVQERIIATEQFLERLTGYRWHIESESLEANDSRLKGRF